MRADSPSGPEDGSDTQPEIIIYGRSRNRFMSMGRRIAEWNHGRFHRLQPTIHDRWARGFRLTPFVPAPPIATQIVFRTRWEEAGLGVLLPSPALTIPVAS